MSREERVINTKIFDAVPTKVARVIHFSHMLFPNAIVLPHSAMGNCVSSVTNAAIPFAHSVRCKAP